jgi:cytochrome c peroxidase
VKLVIWSIFALLLSTTSGVFASDIDLLIKRANRFFEPLPDAMPGTENDTPERIALGKQLFFEKRLSINDNQSCASCHRLEDGFAGVDNLATSPGTRGEQGTRNSPTVLNAGWQDAQFWDGRAEDLVEQAKQPILNPIEMGMPDEKTVEEKIRSIEEYHKIFSDAFPGEEPAITYQNIAEAIAAFERTLITPGRFDDFLNGDGDALNEAERQGLSGKVCKPFSSSIAILATMEYCSEVKHTNRSAKSTLTKTRPIRVFTNSPKSKTTACFSRWPRCAT